MTSPKTIVVVDDHPIFRQGIVDSLSLEDDFAVIGQAATGNEGLDLIRMLSPDLAIVDVNLPGMNGQQIIRQVISEHIPTRMVILTAYDDSEQKIHAMKIGAAAYCTKDLEPERLVDTLQSVVSGHKVVDEEVLDPERMNHWISAQEQNPIGMNSEDPGETFQPLSSREMEVLSYVTQGMSNKEIAFMLGISHQTVKNHITAILRKLGVEDRTQAAIFALRKGWVRLQPEENKIQD